MSSAEVVYFLSDPYLEVSSAEVVYFLCEPYLEVSSAVAVSGSVSGPLGWGLAGPDSPGSLPPVVTPDL